MRSGAPSTTTTGRPSTSSTRRTHPASAFWGEGEESEKVIQRLLKEAGKAVGSDMAEVESRGSAKPIGEPQVTGELPRLRPHGELRVSRWHRIGRAPQFTAPAELRRNQWALSGEWTIGKRPFSFTRRGRIVYRFHARDLHLVMGPATRGMSIRFEC